MALTAGNVGASARTDQLRHGMTVRQVLITTSTGAGGADYSAGFDLGAVAAKLGFRSIFAVLTASAQNAAGTTLSNKVWWTYDHVAQKLRFWAGSSGATNMTEESGTNINAGAKLRVVLLGV